MTLAPRRLNIPASHQAKSPSPSPQPPSIRVLRNPDAIQTGRLDLADYDSIFSDCPKCGFTDVDAVIERNDQFLFVEMKKPGERLSVGQRILYTNLITRSGLDVMIRWGLRGQTEHLQLIGYHPAPIKSSEVTFRKFLQAWWDKANSKEIFDKDEFFMGLGMALDK